MTPSRTYVFSAKDAQDRDDWISAVTQCVLHARERIKGGMGAPGAVLDAMKDVPAPTERGAIASGKGSSSAHAGGDGGILHLWDPGEMVAPTPSARHQKKAEQVECY